MKSLLLILFLFLSNKSVFAQETKTILRAPDDWNSELIHFPLSFAPEIDFEGIEDIRFAPGWSDPQSEQFWTYHFTWYLTGRKSLTDQFLEETMRQYFDGLIKVVLKEEADQFSENGFQQTTCLFIKTKEGFKGKIRLFDAFFTRKVIVLNVKVLEQICEESEKQLISFNLTPQSFDDPLWNIFNDVEIIEQCN